VGTVDVANILGGGLHESSELLYLVNYPTHDGGLPYDNGEDPHSDPSSDPATSSHPPLQPEHGPSDPVSSSMDRASRDPPTIPSSLPPAPASLHPAQSRAAIALARAREEAESRRKERPRPTLTSPTARAPESPTRMPASLIAAQQGAMRARRLGQGSGSRSSSPSLRSPSPPVMHSTSSPGLVAVRERATLPKQPRTDSERSTESGRTEIRPPPESQGELPARPERRSHALLGSEGSASSRATAALVSTREPISRTHPHTLPLEATAGEYLTCRPLGSGVSTPLESASQPSSGATSPKETIRLLQQEPER
ncbi:MAG: hypothetical protein SGPRY_012446, partial [Prymnesium sp.]